MSSYVLVERADRVATVTLNRPQKHNSFNEELIAELTRAFRDLANDATVRVVVLASKGDAFSAGADLEWMKRMSVLGREANERDALALSDLMNAIDRCPKPVLGVVQGSAFGGGVGLVACCDITIASIDAVFALSEVRLGLIPAVISPYVIAAIGERACRYYFLTADRFDAMTAKQLGLVKEVVPALKLPETRDRILAKLLECAPNAQRSAKELIRRVAHAPIDDALVRDTAARIADARASAEGKEGIAAFLQKRKPNWN